MGTLRRSWGEKTYGNLMGRDGGQGEKPDGKGCNIGDY